MDRLRNFFGYSSHDTKEYNGYESPAYTVERSAEDYEVRCYEETKWVGCSQDDDKDESSQFWSLFNYIQGANDTNQKISMTVPVTNEFCKGNPGRRMNFFLPRAFHSCTPSPKNPNLSVKEMERFQVYVRSFGGFTSNKANVEKQVEALQNSLKRDKLEDTYDHDVYYLAVYQSPFRLIGRRNEIFFFVKDSGIANENLQEKTFSEDP